MARIEEVNRLLEVLNSIGVKTTWLNDAGDLEIVPPAHLDLAAMDAAAARRTRSIIMFLGPLLHREDTFQLPYAGGCDLGTRTVEPHMSALRPFGLDIKATAGEYHAMVNRAITPVKPIVLTERGDTVTENAIMAAARYDGVTVIRNASSNYMVQDLCFYLELLGVKIDGVGSTTLTVHGRAEIDVDVDYAPSEDPIEAMSLLTAAIVTELGDHHPPGADRVPRDRAGAAGGDGPRLQPQRRVPGRERPDPAGRPDHPAVARCTRRSTRSTRCRSRA